MKIEDSRDSQQPSGALTAQRDRDAEKAIGRSESLTDLKAASVHLSPRAREYQRARQALAAIDDVDEDKVRAIKDRINSGRYRIDAGQIADKMIRQISSDGD